MSIAVLVVLIAFAVYWYAVRPLPKTSGEITAPIRANATIKRDARGVPHIEAASWQDAIFLQGFVTAQDRLWQMDALRRLGEGELAEVFGQGALAQDERTRRMRLGEIADAGVTRLRPQDRTVFIEYARGVNYFIDRRRGDYSLEFSIPGREYAPKPWTIKDSLAIALVMYRTLTDDSKNDFDRGVLLSAGADPEKFQILFPAVQGQFVSPGSNAWAVSGTHTMDGKPILANDPHLEYGIPGTWHLVHLKAPGLNVSGAALPGVPSVITGHNEQIAWGVTNLAADVMDLYAEQMDDSTGRYAYQGTVQQAQLDRQFIGVKGAKPAEVDIWVTRHGPVIFHQNGRSYSMRWSATDGFGFPFFDLDRAQNWQQFRSALAVFWGPGQNFAYADKSGHIGYQATGAVPIRGNFESNVPLDGASGKFEWNGYIPFDQLPSFCDPAGGIVATANQDPFPSSFPYRVNGRYDDAYRVDQIRARLRAKPRLTVSDMLAIQKDVYAAYDHFLAEQVLAACQKKGSRDELVRDSIPLLRGWNGQMDKDEAAPMMVEALSDNLRQSMVRLSLQPGRENTEIAVLPRWGVVQNLLDTRPAGWVANNDWDTWLLNNFSAALQEGRKRQGSRVASWRWGRLLEWTFAHPVGKQLPLVSGYFDIGPIQMSGSGTTVKQTTPSLGPSERMVVDLGTLDESVQNLAVGESGYVASRHYKDQWSAYYVGKSFPMEFDNVHATDVLRVRAESFPPSSGDNHWQ
ncbi:MAG: penicillin acylase family protein [Acidobacteriaceae bacterium]|nr:penicillin acylase family protein [Acidobacteriaceae bacterium]MBV9501645.1 penicillin acylase family protein [Acidobacteriaceae bacterium]